MVECKDVEEGGVPASARRVEPGQKDLGHLVQEIEKAITARALEAR